MTPTDLPEGSTVNVPCTCGLDPDPMAPGRMDSACRTACTYGTCTKSMGDPYGCGGCCGCMGGCQIAYEKSCATCYRHGHQATVLVAAVLLRKRGPETALRLLRRAA